jgi:Domain of unknown function (DUF4133)
VPGKVFHINRSINKPVEFKGLKAQYVWILGALVVISLILFALLYFIGISSGVCVAIALSLLGISVKITYHLSKKYGQFGLLKVIARRKMVSQVKIDSRRPFKK